jgi:plasmid stabilization system protein ParE
MIIIYSPEFKDRLKIITDYICLDSIDASNNFSYNLKITIENLVLFPQMGKKSTYFDDENIRELMYKTYTIIYKITHKNIIILDIFNQNQPIQK